MKIIISIGLIFNLFVLSFYYMHMFQLNSYFFKKYLDWQLKNINKIIIKNFSMFIILLLVIINNNISLLVAISLLFILIILNLRVGKSKIPLKFTNRVIRMFVTELILIVISFILFKNIICLIVFNIISNIVCIIANLINYPIEASVRKYYINDAKRILKNMPNLIVIGITGSYGKTSTKNYLKNVLSAKYDVLATPKNYNTTMGVVKTIRENLKPIHQIFICEMGATKNGDIKEICDIVNPKYGIITSIGPQHLQSFKTIDNIIKTKFELYDAVNKNNGITLLNYDNEYIKKEKRSSIITYGIDNKKLDYNAYDLTSSSSGLSFMVKDTLFKTKLIGRHNAVNITAAIAMADYLGVPMAKMVPKIKEIECVEHRLQLINKGNLNIIDDSYNSNPVSSKSAIDTLNEFDGIKIIVTPGLIELGEYEEKYNISFGEYMCNVCDYIFVVNSTVSRHILKGINAGGFNQDKVFIVNSPQEAMEKISNMKLDGMVTVLLENDLPDNYNL